ncbi:MAG: type II toxin-antitoxin system VapC family toxin [Candidatus Binatia bacterium]
MIAFFDTSIHIDLLTGALSFDQVVQQVGSVPVRLSPVVASELLQGVSKQPRSMVERIVRQLVPLNRRPGGNAGMMPGGFYRGYSHTMKK